MTSIVDRQKATETTIAKFDGKPLAYGTNDCVKMSAFHLRKLGIKVPLLKGIKYTNQLTALKALKAAGYADLTKAVDALGLPRIAPAGTLIGDLMAIPGEGFGGMALMIVAGNGRVFGVAPDLVFRVGQPLQFGAAWSV